jgi:flagellar basal-body rod protein FlgG
MRRLCLLCVLLVGCASNPGPTGGTANAPPRRQTDRNLDLAIDGEGFFIVQTPAGGFLFTRNGALAVATSGELVNDDGYRLYPPVTVPAGSATLTITPDGVVRREVPDGISELAGQIVLSRFASPAALERDGIYLLPTEASGEPVTGRPGTKGLGSIRVGQLEE